MTQPLEQRISKPLSHISTSAGQQWRVKGKGVKVQTRPVQDNRGPGTAAPPWPGSALPPHLDVLAFLSNDHGQFHLPVHLLQVGEDSELQRLKVGLSSRNQGEVNDVAMTCRPLSSGQWQRAPLEVTSSTRLGTEFKVTLDTCNGE